MENFKNRKFKIPMRKITRGITEKVNIHGRAVAILTDAKTGKIKRVIEGRNIVSLVGEIYYAQRGANEAPTYDFTSGGMKLGHGRIAATQNDTDIEMDLGASYKAIYTGYPKTNDSESGGGATNKCTYKVYWDQTQANALNISEVVICTDNGAPPSGLLCRLLFSSPFSKTAAECLTVYIHHEKSGV